MMRVRSVFCPVDFSEHSRRAFEYALALATFHRARLTVLSVIDPLLAEAAAATLDSDYLRDTKLELQGFVGGPAVTSIPWAPNPRLVATIGQPGEQILEVARFHEADLIVMGTHGLGGLRKLVFGSTTERVLRRTDVPVLAVPLGGTSLVALEQRGPVFTVTKVMGAVDFRAGSTPLARLAAEIACGFHASLILAHVVRPVQATARWREPSAAAMSLHLQTAHAAMDDLATRVDPAVHVEPVVRTGHPADTLTALAAESGAQLIVIGTGTGENGAHRPGSTAYRVLCLSAVPVLAIPPTSADGVESERRIEASHAPA